MSSGRQYVLKMEVGEWIVSNPQASSPSRNMEYSQVSMKTLYYELLVKNKTEERFQYSSLFHIPPILCPWGQLILTYDM